MAQEQLEGIANVSYTEVQTLAWETATDWDNAVSQQNVAHSAYGDLPGADVITLGYDDLLAERPVSVYWPCHDSSGPVEDQSGNNRDGSTEGGVSFDQTGVLGGTSLFLDAADDGVRSGYTPALSGDTAILGWWKYGGSQQSGDKDVISGMDDGGYDWSITISENAEFDIFTGADEFDTNFQAQTTWQFICAVWDTGANEARFSHYSGADGTWNHFTSSTFGTGSTTQSWGLCNPNDSHNASGNYAHFALLEGAGAAMSTTEVEGYGEADTGQLTTATKTASSGMSPDLQNLAYSLNGQSITLDVIGSPGTASEEVVSQVLDGATAYTLTWSNTHQDFRLRPKLETADITAAPTFSGGELVG